MKDLEKQIVKIKGMATLVCLLSFLSSALTYLFFPERLSKVVSLCLIALCFSLGWFTGLLHAIKITEKVKQK